MAQVYNLSYKLVILLLNLLHLHLAAKVVDNLKEGMGDVALPSVSVAE